MSTTPEPVVVPRVPGWTRWLNAFALAAALVPLVAGMRLRLGPPDASGMSHDFAFEVVGLAVIATAVIAVVLRVRGRELRAHHVLAAIALIGAGGYEVVRGATADNVHVVEVPPLDVLHPTQHFFEQWQRGDADGILAEAHPELAKAVPAPMLRRWIDSTTAVLGRYQSVDEANPTITDGIATVTGRVRFERAVATYKLGFQITPERLRLVELHVEIPEALQRKPDLDDVERFGRATVEHLVAGDIARVRDDGPALGLDGAQGAKLQGVVAGLGAAPAIELRSRAACDAKDDAANVVRQCLAYTVRGAQTLTVTVQLTWSIDRWQLIRFDLDRDAP